MTTESPLGTLVSSQGRSVPQTLTGLLQEEGLRRGLRHWLERTRFQHPLFDRVWTDYIGVLTGMNSTQLRESYVVAYDGKGKVIFFHEYAPGQEYETFMKGVLAVQEALGKAKD